MRGVGNCRSLCRSQIDMAQGGELKGWYLKGYITMKTHPKNDQAAREDRTRAIAYALWEEEGCPDGCAEIHWAQACAIVDAEAASKANPGWLKHSIAPQDETSNGHANSSKAA